jgi:hypothetical protein
MSHERYFSLRLPGGIGNQLFGLFASRYIAEKSGIRNILEFDDADYSHTSRPYDIRSFRLKSWEVDYSRVNSPLRSLDSKIMKIMNRCSKSVSFHDKLLWMQRFPLNEDRKISIDKFIQRQMTVPSSLKTKIIFDSYLADFAFYDSLSQSRDKILFLDAPSELFDVDLQQIRSEFTLGVHIRLGDFLTNSKDIGVLTNSYFKRAIYQLLSMHNYKQIVVFSDSQNLALQRISSWDFGIPISILSKSPDRDPSEELLLLSNCQGIVCSNSTFSYWAAKLAQSDNSDVKVVVPYPFRRDCLTSISSIPFDWIQEISEWE